MTTGGYRAHRTPAGCLETGWQPLPSCKPEEGQEEDKRRTKTGQQEDKARTQCSPPRPETVARFFKVGALTTVQGG